MRSAPSPLSRLFRRGRALVALAALAVVVSVVGPARAQGFMEQGPTAPTLSTGATLPTTEMNGIVWFNYEMNAITKDSKLYADGAEGWVAHVTDGLVYIKSFADLTAMLDESLVFLDSLQPAQFDGSDKREIVLRPGTPKERRFSGQAYLVHYGLPQFFFHVTTVYAILRHNGIQIGKKDYMGTY